MFISCQSPFLHVHLYLVISRKCFINCFLRVLCVWDVILHGLDWPIFVMYYFVSLLTFFWLNISGPLFYIGCLCIQTKRQVTYFWYWLYIIWTYWGKSFIFHPVKAILLISSFKSSHMRTLSRILCWRLICLWYGVKSITFWISNLLYMLKSFFTKSIRVVNCVSFCSSIGIIVNFGGFPSSVRPLLVVQFMMNILFWSPTSW